MLCWFGEIAVVGAVILTSTHRQIPDRSRRTGSNNFEVEEYQGKQKKGNVCTQSNSNLFFAVPISHSPIRSTIFNKCRAFRLPPDAFRYFQQMVLEKNPVSSHTIIVNTFNIASGRSNDELFTKFLSATQLPDPTQLNHLEQVVLDEIPVPTPAPAAPEGAYRGIPQEIPGLIEVEYFDYGGEGVGHSDTDFGNIGGVRAMV